MRYAPPRAVSVSGVALLLFAGSLALFWPGIAMYDSVGQFGQALSGHYEDWHPPILAHLWAGLHAVFGGAGAPMLVLQMAAYWAGLGLIAAALARMRHGRAAALVLLVGALPLFVGWQAVILKDTQMLGAMLAAVGIVGWGRIRERPVPVWGWAMVAVLIVYATLVRANAVFATVPLLVMMAGPLRWRARIGLVVVGVGAVLALSPVINHGLLGAAVSGVEKTEPLYDLAGIAVRAPGAPVGLTTGEVRTIMARHCVKPLFWDPLGDDARCGTVMARVRLLPPKQLYAMLAEAVVRHPLAYAGHRLAHLNSTDRWLVPSGWPSAAPPGSSEPNTIGLANPGASVRRWQIAARWVSETPLGWPIAWIVVAVTALTVALRRAPGGPRDWALALLVSALALEASFGVISIASDLRYHLWSMIATALASIVLAADARWPRRATLIGAAVLALVVIGGSATRLLLPPGPASYQAALM